MSIFFSRKYDKTLQRSKTDSITMTRKKQIQIYLSYFRAQFQRAVPVAIHLINQFQLEHVWQAQHVLRWNSKRSGIFLKTSSAVSYTSWQCLYWFWALDWHWQQIFWKWKQQSLVKSSQIKMKLFSMPSKHAIDYWLIYKIVSISNNNVFWRNMRIEHIHSEMCVNDQHA